MGFAEAVVAGGGKSMKRDVEAFDLDATLAEYHGYQGDDHIGEPIPEMMEKVQKFLDEGKEVVIFTARAHNPKSKQIVQNWLEKHGLPRLEVTNIKRPEFSRIYDDRARQVEPNTGRLVAPESEKATKFRRAKAVPDMHEKPMSPIPMAEKE